MRIAIVGAGISGLAAAHLLHRAHEVTVFEAGALPGGHANTVRVDTEHVPQASAVWSADPRRMWTFPARFLIEFFANHGMLGFAKRPQWRTVVGGSAVLTAAVLAAL